MVNATPRPLYPRERDPVPILQQAGKATGPVWTGAKNFAPHGIRSLDRPDRSESLHRRRYPACLLHDMPSEITQSFTDGAKPFDW
jgi:hypothetical protein